jgi:hypothetical protein
MRWWLRKVRVANISPAIRDELERSGEAVLAHALAAPLDTPTSPLHKFRYAERPAAEAWLTERRDIAERKEKRVELVEWAILLFVIVGVVADITLVIRATCF